MQEQVDQEEAFPSLKSGAFSLLPIDPCCINVRQRFQ